LVPFLRAREQNHDDDEFEAGTVIGGGSDGGTGVGAGLLATSWVVDVDVDSVAEDDGGGGGGGSAVTAVIVLESRGRALALVSSAVWSLCVSFWVDTPSVAIPGDGVLMFFKPRELPLRTGG